MKCISKQIRIKNSFCLILTGVLLLTGCGSSLPMQFTPGLAQTGVIPRYAPFFAEDLCVPAGDEGITAASLGESTKAGLFNVTRKETVFAKDIYERINPASLTKIMTALIAIENGDLTRTVVATSNVVITERGAQKIGLQEGDRMTLDQALHILLIHSANDAAILVAESVAGSVDRFTQMMNERAKSLGATGCHFVNPHGLTDPDHYVTAYDLYLIFNEAMRYKEFREIIDTPHYLSSYHTADGTEIAVDIRSTNGYVTGAYKSPETVSIIGGKTGTTAAAGHCLIQLLQNARGEEYIAVVMKTGDADALVSEMDKLLQLVADGR